jgi:hypothetical protein
MMQFWHFVLLAGLYGITSSSAMIVRHPNEQQIAIETGAKFPGVGVVGVKKSFEEDAKAVTDLYLTLKDVPAAEKKVLLEKYLDEEFPENISFKLRKIMDEHGGDIIQFFDQLILEGGVHEGEKIFALKDLLELLVEENLGLAGHGTGTVITPESIGLDPLVFRNRVVITAAHVVDDEKADHVFRLQPQLTNPNLAHYQEYQVSHIFIPHEYKALPSQMANLSGHDFAVLILDKPIDLPIPSIHLKPMEIKEILGRTLLTVGFGMTGYAGSDLTTDFIRRAGYFVINYVNPDSLIYGAVAVNDPAHHMHGADPFRHSQLFLGHPFKGQAEFTAFNYIPSLLQELSGKYRDPKVITSINTIAQQVNHWETQSSMAPFMEVNLTFRYGAYRDQIIKYTKKPDVPVMVLQGDSGGPVFACDRGTYSLVGIVFAGDGKYCKDKKCQVKPNKEFCTRDGCQWVKDYQEKDLNHPSDTSKSTLHVASFVNNISHLIKRLSEKVNEKAMDQFAKFVQF